MIVIFDLDGTLALIEHRRHFVEGKKKNFRRFNAACVDDKPNLPVIEMLNLLAVQGHRIWIFSGRSDEVLNETSDWLHKHGVTYEMLVMRREGDNTPDVELKKLWLNENCVSPKDLILCVFDDRQCVVDMWRGEGLTCLQVAPGNF